MDNHLKIQAEHLIFLATLLEERSNEKHWNKLSEVFRLFSQGQLWYLEVSAEKTSVEGTVYYSAEECSALANSYREEAERIIQEERKVYWPSMRGENLVKLAAFQLKQKNYQEASEHLRKAILSMHCISAAEMLINLPNFENSVPNIRAVIKGLSQKGASAEQKLRAIELATRYGSYPYIKADLARIYFSEEPEHKNETSVRLLNEAGYTDYLEMAKFMAQKYTVEEDDTKAFYWWVVALQEGLQDLPETWLPFNKHVIASYPTCKETFTVPGYWQEASIKKVFTITVEKFYLLSLALDLAPENSGLYKESYKLFFHLVNFCKSNEIRNPALHSRASELYSFEGDYSASIEEECLFVDQLEANDDYIVKDFDVVEETETAEEAFQAFLANGVRSICKTLDNHYKECGQWWNTVLLSKNPKRFESIFDFFAPKDYMKTIPKGDLLKLYKLFNNIPLITDVASLEETFPDLIDIARPHLPKI